MPLNIKSFLAIQIVQDIMIITSMKKLTLS
jgi:hypothetical protein